MTAWRLSRSAIRTDQALPFPLEDLSADGQPAGLMLVLKGPTGQMACVRFLAKKRRRLPDLTLRTDETDVSLKTEHNSRLAQVPADATVFVSW